MIKYLIFLFLSLNQGGTLGLYYPSISPDGSKIAFSYRGDIWVYDTVESRVWRVTLHEATDTRPVWSTDGKEIAFASRRSGNYDIWIVSARGGTPRQVTYNPSTDIPTDWKGDTILFYSFRNRRYYTIFKIHKDGGMPVKITDFDSHSAVFAPDGSIYFVKNGVSYFRKGYRGSANGEIYRLKDGKFERLTNFEGTDRDPAVDASGKLYFISERDSGLQVYRFDGKPVRISHLKRGDALHLAVSKDGKYAVIEHKLTLYKVDLKTGMAEPLGINIETDSKLPEEFTREFTDVVESPSMSPDGKWIAFAMRGDIWIVSSNGGEARKITDDTYEDAWPRFSPDGKKIAFYSNRSGNNDIYVVPVEGGEPERITKDKADDFFQSWSPDGQYIVFTSTRKGNKDIFVIRLRDKKVFQITKHEKADDDPVFSPDGKWIYFDSQRSGNGEIYRIAVEDGKPVGEPERLTDGPGYKQIPTLSPDGKLVAYEVSSRQSSPKIFVMDADGNQHIQLASGRTPNWSGDYIVFTNKGKLLKIRAPKELIFPETVEFTAKEVVKRHEDFKKIFDMAWLKLKTRFYDSTMHGVDWDAVKEYYRPLLDYAETYGELRKAIMFMMGELQASHIGIQPPEGEKKLKAFTGFEVELTENGAKVTKVYKNSPADKAGLKPGDIIVSVDSVSTTAPHFNLFKVVFQKDSIIVNTVDERTLTIKVLPWDTLRTFAWEEWEEKNRKIVEEATDGKVAYHHIRAMNEDELARFKKAIVKFLREGKEGLILDVRYNPGGRIHEALLDILTKKAYAKFVRRGQKPQIQPSLRWGKPLVVLINEFSFSDAEIFPAAVKYLGIGKLVGVPTGGGVIGTDHVKLPDGSTLNVPYVGWYLPDGTNLEGYGVKPDYYVDNDPNNPEKDLQLEKAIEVIMEEIKR